MYLEHIPLFSELNIYSITVRILLALFLGGLIGIEREQKQRPAGFRTYVIVCIGATLTCITNVYMCDMLGSSDPARIPAQVVSGIGFLGAGTILVTRNSHVKGLTTAAGLWCSATIGIAIGSGFYCGAIICSVIIVFSLRILSLVDKYFMKYNKYICIYAEYSTHSYIRNLVKYCKTHNYAIHELEIYRDSNSEGGYVTYTVKIQDPKMRQAVIADMRSFEGALLTEEMAN